MTRTKCAPNWGSCVQILALGQGGEWKHALSIFRSLRLHGSFGTDLKLSADGQESLGPRTWSAIISACYVNGQWSRTLELYSEMRASGMQPEGYLMQTVISACEKNGAWEQADTVSCPFNLHASHALYL